MGVGWRVHRHTEIFAVDGGSHHSRNLGFQCSEFGVTRVDRGGCFGGKEDGSFRTPAGGARRLLGRFGSVSFVLFVALFARARCRCLGGSSCCA